MDTKWFGGRHALAEEFKQGGASVLVRRLQAGEDTSAMGKQAF